MFFRILISIGFVSVCSMSLAQDDLQLKLEKVAGKLGVQKSHVEPFFKDPFERMVCIDTVDTTVRRLHKTSLVYSSDDVWFFAEHTVEDSPAYCYLILPRTAALSLRNRLDRQGFERYPTSSSGDEFYFQLEKNNLLVDYIANSPMVLDVLGFSERCLNREMTHSKEWVVVIFGNTPE